MVRDGVRGSRLSLEALFAEGSLAGLTDGQLLERFATGRGDAAELAFAAMVERHGPMVLRACRGILRDDHEAMDASQATFLVLARRARSLWVRDSLGPWLHRVACRVAGRARAQAGRRRAIEQRLAEATPRPDASPDRDELAAVIHEEVDRLPERYRAAVILCDLEGRTCEEAARHLGCPVGTIGSRLARGRERLRGRLARRGLAPIAGALSVSIATEATAMTVAASGVRPGPFPGSGPTTAGMSSAAAVRLAEDVIRSLFMAKLMSLGAASVALVGLSMAGGWALRPGVGAPVSPAQSPPAKKDRPPEAKDPFPFLDHPERMKDYIYAEIGNMRPTIEDERGVRFQSRQAILYKDGTAKLWTLDRKDPIAPTLRHKDPIRELTFFDNANVLITASEGSIKLWDALTGEPRKELEGQAIGPLWLATASGPRRFVTVGDGGRTLTVWDASRLEAVATLRRPAAGRVAAGLSGDGWTVAVFRFGDDAAVELWDVTTGRAFATLGPPSPAAVGAFTEAGQKLNQAGVERFWEAVRSLSPSAAR